MISDLLMTFLLLLPQCFLSIPSYEIKKKRGGGWCGMWGAHPTTRFAVNTSSLEIQKHLSKYEIWEKVQDLNFHL